jgi:hypothetical protein
MSKSLKRINITFDTDFFLGGVSEYYKDLLDDGYSSEDALHLIMEDTLVDYLIEKKLKKKNYKWDYTSRERNDVGDWDVVLEKNKFTY